MDFQVNFGCGGRAVAETFIFLLSRLPRVCAMCLEYNIIYLLVLCTCRCIPRSTCRFSARMCVRIFFYFLLWTPRGSPCAGRVRVGTVYFACVCAYILFYYYLFICLKERLNFRKVRDIIWSAWVEVLPPDARRNGSKISKNTPFGTHWPHTPPKTAEKVAYNRHYVQQFQESPIRDYSINFIDKKYRFRVLGRIIKYYIFEFIDNRRICCKVFSFTL